MVNDRAAKNDVAYEQQRGPHGLRVPSTDVAPTHGITIAALGTQPAALHFFVARVTSLLLLFLLPLVAKPSLRQ